MLDKILFAPYPPRAIPAAPPMRQCARRSLALAFATVCWPPAAGLSPPAGGDRVISHSTRDLLLSNWHTHQIIREVGLPPAEALSPAGEPQDSPYWDDFDAAVARREAQGIVPRFFVPLPPLSPHECFERDIANLADAGWAAFQSACCDVRGKLSTLLTGAAVSVHQRGWCDQTLTGPDHRASLEALAGRTRTKAASLEALAAVPESDYEKRAQKDRERAYERKAAGALHCRLSEEGGRLKREGKLRGAEEAFARSRKARRAYLGLCRESYLQFLDDLSRAGWAGKYYADRIKGMDADIEQMRRGCAELRAQGKRQAAEEIIARRWQVETQRRLLIEELMEGAAPVLRDCCIEAQNWLLAEVWDGEDREVISRGFKKDEERGVPYGTTYRLQRALAAPPAVRRRPQRTSPPNEPDSLLEDFARNVARIQTEDEAEPEED